MTQIEYNYKDILLQPSHSCLHSRIEADTSINFGGHDFKLPVYPANMKTVIDENLCRWLATNGYFYTMHRFGIDNTKFVRDMKGSGLISSISLGVNQDSYDSVDDICANGLMPEFITIDIAHGDCEKMKIMIQYIKSKLPESFIIAGNVCTKEGVANLEGYGADAVKIGIGPGCFLAGSRVITKNGVKNIEDISIGDEVITHNNRYMKVISTMSRLEEDRLVEINGIKSTANHEYYVVEKKYKDVVTDENIHHYAKWVAAEHLTKEYFLIKSR